MDKEAHVLLIFDSLLDLPPPSSYLHALIQRNNTHIIFIIEENHYSPENLKRQVDKTLLRGTNGMQLRPLSELHVTQRLVHGIMTKCEFAPYNREQDILAKVADKSLGSSDLVDVISALMSKYIDEEGSGFLERFHSEVCSVTCSRSCSVDYSTSCSVDSSNSFSMEDKNTEEIKVEEKEGEGFERRKNEEDVNKKEWKEEMKLKEGGKTEVEEKSDGRIFDGDFVSQLINSFHLSKTDFFVLSTLSLFGTAPLPHSLVEQIQLVVQEASTDRRGTRTPLETLLSASLLNYFPSPVISRPCSALSPNVTLTESSFFCMPLIISQAVREYMDPKDLLFCLSTAHRSLELGLHAELTPAGDRSLVPFLAGLAQVLLVRAEEQDVIYRRIYKTYLLLIDQ